MSFLESIPYVNMYTCTYLVFHKINFNNQGRWPIRRPQKGIFAAILRIWKLVYMLTFSKNCEHLYYSNWRHHFLAILLYLCLPKLNFKHSKLSYVGHATDIVWYCHGHLVRKKYLYMYLVHVIFPRFPDKRIQKTFKLYFKPTYFDVDYRCLK